MYSHKSVVGEIGMKPSSDYNYCTTTINLNGSPIYQFRTKTVTDMNQTIPKVSSILTGMHQTVLKASLVMHSLNQN